MPVTTSCFSNPADLPPGIGSRDAAQSAQSGWLSCFSYSADVRQGGNRDVAQSDVPGLRRMPNICFRY